MKKRIRIALLICFVLFVGTQFVSAEENQGLTVYNTRLVTNDKEATFIEGEVPAANGQTIILKAGLRAVAEKKLPDTGKPAKFKIKVPSKNIGEKSASVLYLIERKDGKNLGKGERVEIEYIERQKQTISTGETEYSMTYPGLDASINAEASSGEKLIYTSSDPSIVEVDDKGNLKAKGQGEAEISVRQIGSSAYEEAEQKVSVSVEEIDAYIVNFHSSDDENATT